jgi:hypothetical protein
VRQAPNHQSLLLEAQGPGHDRGHIDVALLRVESAHRARADEVHTEEVFPEEAP